MTSDWYQDFFQGIVVDFWRVAVTEEHTTADVVFLERELGVAPGARLLDVR